MTESGLIRAFTRERERERDKYRSKCVGVARALSSSVELENEYDNSLGFFEHEEDFDMCRGLGSP